MMKNRLYSFLNNYSSIDYDIFDYGFNIFKSYLYVFFTILIISATLNIVFGEILFWIFYIPLRKYQGGFHFSSKGVCFFTSVLFSLIISYTIRLPIISLLFRLIIITITIITTFLAKTLNHPNKKLSNKEIKMYTARTLAFDFFYAFLLIVPINHNYFYINVLTMTILFSTVNVIFAKIFKQG